MTKGWETVKLVARIATGLMDGEEKDSSTVRPKGSHSAGSDDFRSTNVNDFRSMSLSDSRLLGLSDFHSMGLSDFCSMSLSDFHSMSLSGSAVMGLSDRSGSDGKAATAARAGKVSYAATPPTAIEQLARAMNDGAAKYGRMDWRRTGVKASTYYDAAMRHLLAWWDGEDVAPDSGVHHLAHVMANMAILLDAMERGILEDDRG